MGNLDNTELFSAPSITARERCIAYLTYEQPR
jgi:hypothetical protein